MVNHDSHRTENSLATDFRLVILHAMMIGDECDATCRSSYVAPLFKEGARCWNLGSSEA